MEKYKVKLVMELILSMYTGTSLCKSGNYKCEEQCSDSGNWTVPTSSKKQKVSKEICLSEQAIIRTRDAVRGCSSKGQFCKFKAREIIISQSKQIAVHIISLRRVSFTQEQSVSCKYRYLDHNLAM